MKNLLASLVHLSAEEVLQMREQFVELFSHSKGCVYKQNYICKRDIRKKCDLYEKHTHIVHFGCSLWQQRGTVLYFSLAFSV